MRGFAALLRQGYRVTGGISPKKAGRMRHLPVTPTIVQRPPVGLRHARPGRRPSKPDHPPWRFSARSPRCRELDLVAEHSATPGLTGPSGGRTRRADIASLASPHVQVGWSVLQTDGGCAACRAADCAPRNQALRTWKRVCLLDSEKKYL